MQLKADIEKSKNLAGDDLMPLMGFIEQSNMADTLDELVECYSKAIGHFGFNRFDYSLMTTSTQFHREKCAGLVTNYSQSWIDHYKQNGYIEDDPVYTMTATLRELFPWSAVEALALNKKQKAIIKERDESGLRNGHSIFIAGPFGETIGMSIANDGAIIHINNDILSQLFAITNQFNLRCIAILGVALKYLPINLSNREKEVILWSSQGKSNSTIATLMGTSHKTVEFHFSSIFKKLHVNNRVLAVLKAIKERLISP